MKPDAPAGEYLTTDAQGAPPPAQGYGWFKASRSPDAIELAMAAPNAFRLAYIIAYRARWRDGFHAGGLAVGEAFIGDWKRCGFSRQGYRTALRQLVGWGFVTAKPTSKGTIARLADTRLFDVFPPTANHQNNQQLTISQPSANHQPTISPPLTKNGKRIRIDRAGDLIERDARSGKEAEEERPAGSIKGMTLQLGQPAPGDDWHAMSLSLKLLKLLGAREATDPRWARRAEKAPDDLGEILDKMNADIREGAVIKNRGAYAETLWKVSRKFNG